MAYEIQPLVTAEEFARLPDDGMRRELVRGEVIEMPPSAAESARVSMCIGAPVHMFAKANDAGAVYSANGGFVLMEDPDIVRVPDVGFVAKERFEALAAPEGFFPGAPDLAVEVVSPTDQAADLQAKVTEYLEAGTALVWVVYPRTRQVAIHRPAGEATVIGEDGVLTGEPVLPGRIDSEAVPLRRNGKGIRVAIRRCSLGRRWQGRFHRRSGGAQCAVGLSVVVPRARLSRTSSAMRMVAPATVMRA